MKPIFGSKKVRLPTVDYANDRAFYQQLSHRYQFAALEVESRNGFIILLMGLGSVLIGMGVLTFVAANWQQLAREWRVIMLLSLFIAVNVAGFYLWREAAGRKQRLGQGLLLLGAVILGGNMGLMGQMFHVRGDTSQLFIAWAIGVLLMAYSLRLTSLGIFAQILMGIGYWQIYITGQWSIDRPDIDPNWTYFVYEHMSIAAIVLFLPLAYLCRSQAIFALTGIAFVSAFQGNLLPLSMSGRSVIFALLCSLPPLLLWGYGNLSGQWQIVGEASPKENRRNKIVVFPQISRRLAIISLGLTCFALSFSAFWSIFESEYRSPVLSQSSIWDGASFALITIGTWAYLIWQTYRNSERYPWNWMTTAIAGTNCVMAGTIIAQINSIDSNIPFQSIYALATGTTVILKTRPVDPYALLRGYYQVLSYDISDFNTLRKLPGWAELNRNLGRDKIDSNQQVYITLAKIPAVNSQSPEAWKPIAIGDKFPVDLSADKIAIKGTSNGSSIIYGLETYYMPEDRKDDVNKDIDRAQSSGGKRNLLVEIKVDNRGLATPVSLWVGSKQYRF